MPHAGPPGLLNVGRLALVSLYWSRLACLALLEPRPVRVGPNNVGKFELAQGGLPHLASDGQLSAGTGWLTCAGPSHVHQFAYAYIRICVTAKRDCVNRLSRIVMRFVLVLCSAFIVIRCVVVSFI